MTVTYAKEVHTVTCGGFLHLMRLWKGSLLKGIWKDLLIYIAIFSGITTFYRQYLVDHPEYKEPFEIMCVYCRRFSTLIPLSFLLGFYVSLVVTRWWSQFTTLAWPDTLAMSLKHYLPGPGQARSIRRSVVRWSLVSNILALRMVSPVVEKRFPSYQSMVDEGFLTQKELTKLEHLDEKLEGKHQMVWYPIQWAQALLGKAHKSGLLPSDLHFWYLVRECINISRLNSILILFIRINIPLVYTQVVTIAVYSYFLASLFGAQYLQPTIYMAAGTKYVPVDKEAVVLNTVNLVGYDSTLVDTYIPIFNVLEFVFYVGWLQVAVALINPFGEDDEDFDVNYLIDRNIQIGLFMVEEEEVKLEANAPPCAFEYGISGLAGANNIVNILRTPTLKEKCLSKLCCCCPDSAPSSPPAWKQHLPSAQTQLSPPAQTFQLDVTSMRQEAATLKVQAVPSQSSMSSFSSRCSMASSSSEKCTCNCPLHDKPSQNKPIQRQQIKRHKVSPTRTVLAYKSIEESTEEKDQLDADIETTDMRNAKSKKISKVHKRSEQLKDSNMRTADTSNIENTERPVTKQLLVTKVSSGPQQPETQIIQHIETQELSPLSDNRFVHQSPVIQIIEHIGTQNVFPLLNQDHAQGAQANKGLAQKEHLVQNIKHVDTQNVFPVELKRPSSFRTLSPAPTQQSPTSSPPSITISSTSYPPSIITTPPDNSTAAPSTKNNSMPSSCPLTVASIISPPSETTNSTTSKLLSPKATTSTPPASIKTDSLMASSTTTTSPTTPPIIPSTSSTPSFVSCTDTSSSTASYSSSSTTTSSPPAKPQLPSHQRTIIVRQDSIGPHSAPLPHRKFNF